MGRFTSQDPYWNHRNLNGSILAIRQSTNLYAYCLNNPLGYVDPDGQLAYPGQLHNAVVNHITAQNQPSMLKNRRIRYVDGYGYADLIYQPTGEVWEVKREGLSLDDAVVQLTRYVSHRMWVQPLDEIELHRGSVDQIGAGSFIKSVGTIIYQVTFSAVPGGVVFYDYSPISRQQASEMKAADSTLKVYGIVATAAVAARVILFPGGCWGDITGDPVLR